MTFTDIPPGESVFVDANTLVYHFVPDPDFGPPCRDLLERFGRQELIGFTSAHVLSNVAHRIMTLEAIDQQVGLLSGDALVVAVMRGHGLSSLASHDADFDRVPGLTRYSPA